MAWALLRSARLTALASSSMVAAILARWPCKRRVLASMRRFSLLTCCLAKLEACTTAGLVLKVDPVVVAKRAASCSSIWTQQVWVRGGTTQPKPSQAKPSQTKPKPNQTQAQVNVHRKQSVYWALVLPPQHGRLSLSVPVTPRTASAAPPSEPPALQTAQRWSRLSPCCGHHCCHGAATDGHC